MLLFAALLTCSPNHAAAQDAGRGRFALPPLPRFFPADTPDPAPAAPNARRLPRPAADAPPDVVEQATRGAGAAPSDFAPSDAAPANARTVTVAGRLGRSWVDPDDPAVTVTLLRGDCRVSDGTVTATARNAVLWHRRDAGPGRDRLTVYLEDGVRVVRPTGSETLSATLLTFPPADTVAFDVPHARTAAPAPADPLFVRAARAREYDLGGRTAAVDRGAVPPPAPADVFPSEPAVSTEMTGRGSYYAPQGDGPLLPVPADGGYGGVPSGGGTGGDPFGGGGSFGGGSFGGGSGFGFGADGANAAGLRSIQLSPGSSVPPTIRSFESTDTIPPEQVTVVTGRAQLRISGAAAGGFLPANGFGGRATGDPADDGAIGLAANNIVIWTRSVGQGGIGTGTSTLQPREMPLTVYLEGDIEVRRGRNVIRAQRAVYDVRADRGLLLDAELSLFVPQAGASVRVRAEQLRQLDAERFRATNAFTTTSQFGVPGYRLQAREIFVEPRYDAGFFANGVPAVDPISGRPTRKSTYIRSEGNTLFLGNLPVLYAPLIAGPAENPNLPIKNVNVGNDRTFGTRAEVVLDGFSLLGVDAPAGVEADILLGGYTARGVAGGVRGGYAREDFLGLPGRAAGDGIGWYVRDDGLDRLGELRNDVEPPDNDRYRLRWRHQQTLPAGAFAGRTRFLAELGIRSDINVLEEWWETEWDRAPDEDTLLYGTGTFDDYGFSNWAWEGLGQLTPNDFETDTGWYPKLDLYGLGQPLLGGRLLWSQHSVVGYGDLQAADYPTDPGVLGGIPDLYTPIPYAPDVEGLVAHTRHELSAPVKFGGLTVAPFLWGDLSHQGEGIDGDDVSRAAGSAGFRASLPLMKVWRGVNNRTLGLDGLAHKIRYEIEYRATGTTRDYTEFAQYNALDEDAQQQYRARLPASSRRLFDGGGFPAGTGFAPDVLDPRFYAVRTGAGLDVTSAAWELVDDQQTLRVASHHRLQTKAGPPGARRVRDWMTLDLSSTFFPNPGRDNFGETRGLVTADYAWHVGERTSFLASGQRDAFAGGPRRYDVGVLTGRGRRGSAYLGLRRLEALGLDSSILTGSVSYLLGPKWAATGTAFVDVEDNANNGQAVTVTRLGADFNVHVGVDYNANVDDFGASVLVEPRFGTVNDAADVLGRFRGGVGAGPL